MVIVSVVVPCYNIEQFVGDCVNSIINQTFKDWELILVDDGSTDQTGEICEQIAKSYSNIVVIHQENQGVSAARRAGLLRAQGGWVTFPDGDDILPPYALERMMTICSTTNVEMFVGRCCIQTDKYYYQVPAKIERYGVYFKEEYINLLANYKVTGSLCLRLFRRELLIKNDIIIPRMIINNEDYLYNLFLSSYVSTIYISNDIVYFYNHTQLCNSRKGRATNRKYLWNYWEMYFSYLYDNYRKHGITENTYIHSVLTKLSALIRNDQDYKSIDMDIPPFKCIANIKSFSGYDIWQRLVIIIYRHRWIRPLLIQLMRIHPKRLFVLFSAHKIKK